MKILAISNLYPPDVIDRPARQLRDLATFSSRISDSFEPM